MISSLRGTVAHIGADALVIEVGGVGMSVAVPSGLARGVHLGDTTHVFTHLVVREDQLALFGFGDREELDLFTVLLGVSGVGPKSALGILSELTVDQIAEAVANEDDRPFRKVSGIGPKTAKLIAVQLAGKIAPPVARATQTAAQSGVHDQVTVALTGLGWNERVAAEAIAAVVTAGDVSADADVQTLLRVTLAALGPAQSGAKHG